MPRFLYLLSAVTARGPSPNGWRGRRRPVSSARARRLQGGARLERADGVVTVGEAVVRWGFLVVEAEDARAALAIAASCPGDRSGNIELYRLDADTWTTARGAATLR